MKYKNLPSSSTTSLLKTNDLETLQCLQFSAFKRARTPETFVRRSPILKLCEGYQTSKRLLQCSSCTSFSNNFHAVILSAILSISTQPYPYQRSQNNYHNMAANMDKDNTSKTATGRRGMHAIVLGINFISACLFKVTYCTCTTQLSTVVQADPQRKT